MTPVTDRQPDAIAPDGMEVRLLPKVAGGSMAHFRMPAGKTGRAVSHRTVEELWHILAGTGVMWMAHDEWGEKEVPLQAGASFSIPLGTRFQLRNTGADPLDAVAVTIPAWPGDDEAVFVEGKWQPTVEPV